MRSRYYSISSKPGYASEAAALKREIDDLEDEYSTCLNLKNAAKKYEEYESYISEANKLSKNEPKKHEVNVIAICREYGVDNYEKYL